MWSTSMWENSVPSADRVVVSGVYFVAIRYVESNDRVAGRSSVVRRPALRLILTFGAMYYDISVEGSAECNELRLATISTTRSHASKVFFEWVVNILLFSCTDPTSSWPSCFEVVRGGIKFKVETICSHVVDHTLADFWVFGRVGKELIGKGGEETVA